MTFSNINPENKTLSQIREEAYNEGVTRYLKMVESALKNEKLTAEQKVDCLQTLISKFKKGN